MYTNQGVDFFKALIIIFSIFFISDKSKNVHMELKNVHMESKFKGQFSFSF